MAAAVAGFLLGLSLILAIGPQNAFVLRQGIRGEHVLPVVLVCATSDAVLIACGVAGFGWIALVAPWIVPTMRWGGAAFLLVYGAMSFRAAFFPGSLGVGAANEARPLWKTLLACLALTWLNPHVYLDTVVLLGSVSSNWPGEGLAFGAGAVTASFLFFFSLGFGARFLAPLFARPAAWRVLDVLIGIVMWTIAATLVLA